MFGPYKNIHHVINSSERSDILVFNCYLCHVRFLLTCYVCSTKIGEKSDISQCFEDFVSQTLGVLTRIYAAELRPYIYGRRCILCLFIFVVGMLLCNNFLLSKPIACALEQPYKAKSFSSSFGFSSVFFKFYRTFLCIYTGV